MAILLLFLHHFLLYNLFSFLQNIHHRNHDTTQPCNLFLFRPNSHIEFQHISHLLSQIAFPIPIPIATTAINILGSLILGCIAGSVSDRTQSTYLLLGVGLCGGFTTFSTFSLELVEQLQSGKIGLALMECALNVILGVAALYLGLMLCQSKAV
jgi:CrcB protein